MSNQAPGTVSRKVKARAAAAPQQDQGQAPNPASVQATA
jgi:hypothetical protein